jgi:type IV pilus assembly protein PilB
MTPSRLVDFFQQNNKIAQAQADEVRVELTTGAKSEENLLIEKGFVSQDDIAQAKASMFNIPYVDLRGANIDESVFSSVSAEKLKKYSAVPYEQAGHIIKVAMSDPFDVQAIQALESLLKAKYGGKVLVHVATKESIDFILDSNIGGLISNEVAEALDDFEGPVTELKDTGTDELSGDLQNAPVARIVDSIFQYAIKSDASDIHIEPQEGILKVRFRIHGVMTEKLVLPSKLKNSVVARLKIMANMKIDEKRIPLDGRLQIKTSDRRFDVRVSTLPSIYGEKVVMRLLDNSGGIPPLELSGMRGSGYDSYLESIKATNGIILITGPTGSGKTRTLASTLGILNKPSVNIVTLENPVEIRIQGVTQVQINTAVGLTFAKGLRSILRQDPDIIMVGEIRDQETADLAVEASLTGHLVLATLHTNSAAASIQRLIDMGIEPYLLASTLKSVVAQRLARRICSDCMESYIAPPEVLENIRENFSSIQGFDPIQYLQQIAQSASLEGAPEHLANVVAPTVGPDGTPQVYLYRGKGCQRCGGSGYKGRVGIFEVMKMSSEIESMTIRKQPESDIDKQAVSEGMISMIQDGYLKSLEAMTTIEEVLRVSRE